MEKGQKVKDLEGYMGVIVDATDPHNIQVDFGPPDKIGPCGIGLYCVVPGCDMYDPLEAI